MSRTKTVLAVGYFLANPLNEVVTSRATLSRISSATWASSPARRSPSFAKWLPAVQRMAIPEASPTLPLAASLGITFSYNVTVGIPVYILLANLIAGAA